MVRTRHWILVCGVLASLGAAQTRAEGPQSARRIEIAVNEKGFDPNRISVRKGEPLALVFTRKTDQTCVKEVIVYLDDNRRIRKALPLGKPVEFRVTFSKTGELGYSCAMQMKGGVIKVQ